MLLGVAAALLPGQFSQRVTEVDVPVSAVDRYDRLVTTLRSSDLLLYDNGRQTPITSMLLEDGPASVTFLIDVSGSMRDQLPFVQSAVAKVLLHAFPEDEFAVVEFSDRPELTVPFSASDSGVANRLKKLRAEGWTSLIDSMVEAVNVTLRSAKHKRRALIIISDGGDTHSRFREGEAIHRLMEADVRVYALELYPPMGEGYTPDTFLNRAAQLTGGRYISTYSPKTLPRLIERFDVHRFYRVAFASCATTPEKPHSILLRWAPGSKGRGVRLFWRMSYRPSVN